MDMRGREGGRFQNSQFFNESDAHPMYDSLFHIRHLGDTGSYLGEVTSYLGEVTSYLERGR